jgi:hypothetical protein
MKIRELRDFLNTLTDEQLDQDAVVAGVEKEGGTVCQAEVLAEDWVSDEEGCYPRSAWDEMKEPGEPEIEVTVAMPKGHVYIVFE